MSKLRVVETYVSYQGEGPNTSRPTVFVRFAGCNFKCAGWPCDTQHAIDPKQFTKLQKLYEPIDLADEVAALKVDNVCLTGGEVFLQPQEELEQFLDHLKSMSGYRINIECFTNGALEWSPDVVQNIDNFILDWKLPGSGESYTPDSAIEDNLHNLTELDAIKFTIKNRHDYEVAKDRYANGDLNIGKHSPRIYAGVVWGETVTTEMLCDWMMNDKLPWNLNVQVHKYVWDPNKIGV